MTEEKTEEAQAPVDKWTEAERASYAIGRVNREMAAKLAARKTAVMAEIERVAERGRNDHSKYSYAKAEDLMEEVRPLMASKGLAFTFDVVGHKVEQGKTTGGKPAEIATVEIAATLTDVDTGFAETSRVVGRGSDVGDKAIWKAYTGAIKYWLRNTFLISTGDDPETETIEMAPSDKGGAVDGARDFVAEISAAKDTKVVNAIVKAAAQAGANMKGINAAAEGQRKKLKGDK